MPFLALPAFQPLCVFAVLLVLKMGALAFATANRRRLAKVVMNPEDVVVNPGSHAEPQEAGATSRIKRAHQNDCENIPGFLALAIIYTLAGGTSLGAWSYFGVYFVARTLHSVFYVNGVQPWRTASFFLGWIAEIGLIVQILLKALAH